MPVRRADMSVVRTIWRWARPKKSNGVPVPRGAWRLIVQGDQARSRGDWPAAQRAYQDALAIAPELGHIWVQLGHAAKEAGDERAATDSYQRAAALMPDDPEPLLRLGHMAKRAGSGDAGSHFVQALRRSPEDLSAANEVMQHLAGGGLHKTGLLDEALRLLRIDDADLRAARADQTIGADTTFFDITDLMGFLSYSRIPSGVQRVQIEAMLALIVDDDRPPMALCCYSSARQGWSLIAAKTFVRLCASSIGNHGTTDWESDLRLSYVATALADDLVFPRGAVLVSFGASSPDANYLLNVRTRSDRDGLIYVPVVYDLIPVLFPRWFTRPHAQEFASYAQSLVNSARGFIAISDATRRDLLTYAAREGAAHSPEAVGVTRLDAAMAHGAGEREEQPQELHGQDLAAGRFVLFVSTIEPRKNHLGAFRAWRRLASDVGQARMPRLVCVGGKGWLNDEVHAELANDPRLARNVTILSGVSDQGLDWLYRHCAFTLYPSFYEGWGLPITESLSYGKVPVASNTSSMPEAGENLAIYIDPNDPASIVDAVRPLILDRSQLAQVEQRVRDQFHPRAWRELGRSLLIQAREIGSRAAPGPMLPPALEIDEIMSLASPGAARGRSNGECYRLGRGWGMPGPQGCEAGPADAVLRLPGAGAGSCVRVALRAGGGGVGYRIGEGGGRVEGTLAPDAEQVVTVQVAGASSDGGVPTIAVDRQGEGTLWVSSFALEG